MASKVAIITGAGSGIGKACAIALTDVGFHVALLGRRASLLDDVAAGIGPRALAIPTDVTNEADVVRAFAAAEEKFGRVDLLFNNAGTNAPPTSIDELSLEQWQNVLDVNLTGAFLCAREAVRHMKDQNPVGGRIINNGSISAHVPRLNAVAYTASKHAITGLTRALALEGRPFDIACGQIDVGNAQSEMTQGTPSGQLQPNGELVGEPVIDVNLVAQAVVYMASLPLDANVLFMTVMATKMPYVGRG